METVSDSYLKTASKAEIKAELEKGVRAEKRIERVERSRKKLAIATVAMGAEAAGALAGGVAVGYMQAKDYEEYMGLATVGIGVFGMMKRLDEPTNPYWMGVWATALGMGGALASGYSRDYFSGGQSQPMT